MKINIVSLGNPQDPKTWSGTPFHIFKELEKLGRCDKAFSSELISFAEKILSKLSKLFYFNSENSERAFIQRFLRAGKISKKTLGFNPVLHLGTLDLPFLIHPKQNHYLYCDSTWNLYSKHSISEKKTTKIVSVIAERLEQKSYQQVKHIFTISEYVKTDLIEHYKIPQEKITVAGTGLGIINPYYGEKDYSNHKILFAAKGRFKDKGGDLVLKAFKYINKEIPDARLTIVGQNEYTSTIKEPNIVAHGYIPDKQLQEIFNTHSLFLMPAYNEAWGLVYLEAMACKMPIIGLNRNSFPEISSYGEYGFGLDEDNAEQLANVVIKAFKDPDNIYHIGLRAQKYCLKKYTWDNVVKTIIERIDILEK